MIGSMPVFGGVATRVFQFGGHLLQVKCLFGFWLKGNKGISGFIKK